MVPRQSTKELAEVTLKGLDTIKPVLAVLYPDGNPTKVRAALINARIWAAMAAKTHDTMDDNGALSNLTDALDQIGQDTGVDVLKVYINSGVMQAIPLMGVVTPPWAESSQQANAETNDEPLK